MSYLYRITFYSERAILLQIIQTTQMTSELTAEAE